MIIINESSESQNAMPGFELNYCEDAGLGIIDREKIDIIGEAKPADHIIKYQLAGNIVQQLEWKNLLQLQGQENRGTTGARRGG